MKIGVLTGGGDCPGLNPCIRAVVFRAKDYDFEVIGIEEGWRGLAEGKMRTLSINDVDELICCGGTILGTSRFNPLKDPQIKAKVTESAKSFYALIVIGGEDTLTVANTLHGEGLNVVGVPKTMDNDLSGTDYTFGFDSATTVAVEALDRLRDTAKSHKRIMVLEVMGRYTGWVALFSGIASGADWILLPEDEVDIEALCEHLVNLRARGKEYALIVVSEGVKLTKEERGGQKDEFGHVLLKERGVGEVLAKQIKEKTGYETRSVAIGHIQRGGAPTLFDRILATRLGIKAVELVHEGKFGRMVALEGDKIIDIPLETALYRKEVSAPWLSLYKALIK